MTRSPRILIVAAALVMAVPACTGDAVPDEPSPGLGTSAPTTGPTVAVTATSTTAASPGTPKTLIAIRSVDGVAEFYDVTTDEKWVPRGSNLVRVGENESSPLSVWHYDKEWNEARLTAMEDLGYNAVRVMFELCSVEHCVAGPNERVSAEFLDNATEFLEMAALHGIHVMYTSNDLPGDSWYAREAFVEGESDFLTERNLEVYTEYYTDILNGLMERDAPLDWLWSLEIRNEYTYQLDTYPWSSTEGAFTAANGETYEMGSDEDRRALSTEALTFWADQMTETIKTIRPETLVSIGLLAAHDKITPFGPEDARWLIVGDFHEKTKVDFFDNHGSRPDAETAMAWQNISDLDAKPVIVGEFGASERVAGSVDIATALSVAWQRVSCEAGFDGWLTWHWIGRPDDLWSVEESILGEALSPRLHPDPCEDVPVRIEQVSWHRPVRASATESAEYGPENLTDSDPESYWSAGAGTPQWFEIDFGEPATLGTFRLPIGIVTPDGEVVIDVHGYGPGSPDGTLLYTFDTTMAPGDVLEHTLETPVTNISRVRFTVRRMRDWVIFHGAEVFRAPE